MQNLNPRTGNKTREQEMRMARVARAEVQVFIKASRTPAHGGRSQRRMAAEAAYAWRNWQKPPAYGGSSRRRMTTGADSSRSN